MQLCFVLHVFARVVLHVFASNCWFLVSFYFSLFVRGFAYLSIRSLSIEGGNRLLSKVCGTFSPDEKTFHFIVWIFSGTYHKFPFTGFLAMLSTIFTQMVDSIATSLSTKTNNVGIILEIEVIDMVVGNTGGHFHKHHHGPKIGIEGTQLLPLLPW